MSDRQSIARRSFEAWNAADIEGLVGIMDPEVEVRALITRVDGVPYRGHEGVRRWHRDAMESFDFFHVTADEVREVGDRLVVLGRMRTRGHDSGVELEQPIAWVMEFRGERILRSEVFPDHESALRAAST